MPARKADVVLHRLSSGARSAGPTRIRYPWNERRKRRTRKRDDLSQEQREALKAAREKKKDDLREALLDAREIIWKLALDMEATFGGHKVNYYFRLILQNVLHLKKAPRKISLWNAYVSKELRRINDGTLPYAIASPQSHINIYVQKSPRRPTAFLLKYNRLEYARLSGIAQVVQRKAQRRTLSVAKLYT